MYMHFESTAISPAPMLTQEARYWLSRGEKIFLHRGVYWVRLVNSDGSKVMIEVPSAEVKQLDTPWIERVGIVIRLKDEYASKFN
jgi:hypothetical protein